MFLIFCWLLVAIAYETEGRVDNDFTKCIQYFFKEQIPVGFEGIAKPNFEIPDEITKIHDLEQYQSLAYICQTYNGKRYYATLYDRNMRIPLYSAYILDMRTASTRCTRVNQYNLEPQLINRELNENMLPIITTRKAINTWMKKNNVKISAANTATNLITASQAVKCDYTNRGYSKGHLNPCGHHMDMENYLSTFTLTNIVPMIKNLNSVSWSQHEDEMVKIAAGCSKMYVVTGSVPGSKAMNDCVNIPSHVWNAYCCLDNNDKPIKSGGAIAENDMPPLMKKGIELSALQEELKNLLKVSNNIQIFHDNCKIKDDQFI